MQKAGFNKRQKTALSTVLCWRQHFLKKGNDFLDILKILKNLNFIAVSTEIEIPLYAYILVDWLKTSKQKTKKKKRPATYCYLPKIAKWLPPLLYIKNNNFLSFDYNIICTVIAIFWAFEDNNLIHRQNSSQFWSTESVITLPFLQDITI